MNTHNTTTLANFHVLRVTHLGETVGHKSKIKIVSDRFKATLRIDWDTDGGELLEQAELWLINHGYNVLGHGEAKEGWYIITDTFKYPHQNNSATRCTIKSTGERGEYTGTMQAGGKTLHCVSLYNGKMARCANKDEIDFD